MRGPILQVHTAAAADMVDLAGMRPAITPQDSRQAAAVDTVQTEGMGIYLMVKVEQEEAADMAAMEKTESNMAAAAEDSSNMVQLAEAVNILAVLKLEKTALRFSFGV